MKVKSLHVLLVLCIACNAGLANDSLLVEVKKYISSNIGAEVQQTFYTKWSSDNNPTIILFVSSASKVLPPAELYRWRISFRDEETAKRHAVSFTNLGHHAFVYKTYATSLAELNQRFVSYSNEDKCFIMLHEFIHIHSRRHFNFPYEYEEALADLVGHYGAIQIWQDYGQLNRRQLRRQKSGNERIYKTVNKTIRKIDADSADVTRLNLKCQKRIEKIIKDRGLFFSDRFGYEVNNGFLLKNSFYSKHYFTLKKILLKSGSIPRLLEIMKNGPSKSEDFEKYLKTFI